MDLLHMPGVSYCEFEKNDIIMQQGDKIDYIYYLASGTCYRTVITEKGDEIIYGVKESNKKHFVYSLLGVLTIYSSSNLNLSHFIAKTKCCCYKIPREVFLNYVQDKPEILNELLHMSVEGSRLTTSLFQSRQEGKAANFLCFFLLVKAAKKEGQLRVGKIYTNAEISRFLGMHKVTVAKILKELRDEGIIEKDKEGIIILDDKRLFDYAHTEKKIKY